MSFRAHSRRALPFAAPAAFMVAAALTVACFEPGSPTAVGGGQPQSLLSLDVAPLLSTKLQVRKDLRLATAGEFRFITATTLNTTTPTFPFHPDDGLMTSTGDPVHTVRQFRKPDGTLVSFAVTKDQSTGVPTQFAEYDNGKLRYLARPLYVRFGSGWMLQNSDMTVYNAIGDSSFTVRLTNTLDTAAYTTLRRARRLQPALASVESTTSDLCDDAIALYIGASGAVATALEPFAADLAQCASGSIVACGEAMSEFYPLAAAMTAWYVASGRVETACGGGTEPKRYK